MAGRTMRDGASVCTVSRMRAACRTLPPLLDVGIAIVATGMIEWIVWVSADFGTPIAGRRWLVACLPLVIALPLAWRRSLPLLAWTLIMSGFALQAIATGNSPEGLELFCPLFVGVYSVAAYSRRRAAFLGLGVGVLGYAVYALENRDFRSGRTSDEWATSFFAVALIAAWLLGMAVHSRRESATLAARTAELEHAGERAVAEERARMARELHDIVAHNLSVVVVQAAGSRASGEANAAALEKIERSGREALVEMRRLLGVLRGGDSSTDLAPQPGVAELDQLVASVRAAGLPVELDVGDGCRDLPPAVGLCAYRIVQEALTNTLRHAGPATAQVMLRREFDLITVEIADNGATDADKPAGEGGHGLIGMRERVALFGGDLQAEPRPHGGFTVRARLPVTGRAV